ncbi:MAG: glycosyl hydrolase [Prevotellaceae bacterium]|jgi:glucosylceramidase|nr:glycosyl hydrolase [Prevotellaceae bacterium]
MKTNYTKRTLVISVLIIFSMSLFAQTEGKKVRIFASNEKSNEMLSEWESAVFKQDLETENLLINIYPEFQYQKVLGFGGAFTETSAYNFSLLKPDLQHKLAELYFGKSGIGLNFCRTHIHSADFALDEYTYVTEGDTDLKTFSIERDKKYIVPMIKAARAANPDLWLFASPWSPPAFMKDNKSLIKGGRLLPQFYQTWANYFSLYLKEYQKEGIDFLAVTVQNEPKAVQTWESCIWTGKEEGVFAANYLRPTLDAAGFGDTKIMVWDHNKERVMERARESINIPGADEAIWGVGFHWYSGDHFDNLRMAHELYPDKPLIATEFCIGSEIQRENWGEVEQYAREMIGNFNNFMAASVDWNLIVDLNGGPFHDRATGVKAQVFVDADKKEFLLGQLYYTVGHFSKFIRRDAVRIGSSTYNEGIKTAAFQNPDGEIVVVILNTTDRDATPKLRLNNCTADFQLPAKSLQTLVIPSDGNAPEKK